MMTSKHESEEQSQFKKLLASLLVEARDAAIRSFQRERSTSAFDVLNSGKKLAREEKSEKDTPRPFDACLSKRGMHEPT